MSRRVIRPIDLAAAIILAMGVCSFARAEPPAAPAPTPSAPTPHTGADAPAPDDAHPRGVLSGPDIGRAALPSIVSRTFEGTLVRLDIWPELAAIERLDLAEDTRARISDILADRAAAFDAVVSENLDDLLKLANDGEGGRLFGAVTRLRAFKTKIDARLSDTRPLIEQFAEVLSEPQAAELQRMVDEYRDAFLADEVGEDLEKLGGGIKAALAAKADSLRLLGEELGRAYQRIEKSAAVYGEYFVRELGFTGENAREVRDAVRDFVAGVDDPENISQQDWIPVIRSLYKKLDEQGRERLFNAVLDQK